jgi:hypothetical protein
MAENEAAIFDASTDADARAALNATKLSTLEAKLAEMAREAATAQAAMAEKSAEAKEVAVCKPVLLVHTLSSNPRHILSFTPSRSHPLVHRG